MEIKDKKKQTNKKMLLLSAHDLGLPVPKAGELSNKSC